jgi:hypothetical protein
MTSLVEKLQRDAVDQNVQVSALLRHVKLIAAKLDLGKVERWVDLELNGYGNDEIPPYRQVRGLPRVHNPVNGMWMPIIDSNPAVTEKLSVREVGQKISELEHLIKDGADGTLQIPFPPQLINQLNQGLPFQFGNMALLMSSASIVGILEAVRDRVLTWAIELERLKIKGDDYSFSDNERKQAHQPNITMVIENIGTFTGNLGVGNTARDVTSTPIDLDQVRKLVAQIKSHAGGLKEEGIDAKALADCLQQIENEVKRKNVPLLRKALETLNDVVAKTADGLISTGIGALLHQILGTGVPS